MNGFDGFLFGKDGFRAEFARLLERLGVPERSRKWYVVHLERWERYCVGQGGLGAAGWPGRVKEYLEYLEAREVADWQIRQVLHAIELAHRGVLRESWVDELDWEGLRGGGGEPGEPGDLERVEGEARAKGLGEAGVEAVGSMVRRMREKHLAYRTEVNYRSWLERLFLWSQRQGAAGEMPGEEAARAFLSDLAVVQLVSSATPLLTRSPHRGLPPSPRLRRPRKPTVNVKDPDGVQEPGYIMPQ